MGILFARGALVMRGPEHELRRVLASSRKAGSPTSECLTEAQLAALADGTTTESVRAPLVAHLAQCEWCRSSLASIIRAVSIRDAGAAADVQVHRRRSARRLGIVATVAAAAAVIVFVVLPHDASIDSPTHRAPTLTAAAAPQPVSPVGQASSVNRFVWGAVAGADVYRVTVYSADGKVMVDTRVADTILALPGSLDLEPGTTYLWKVEAGTGFDRWTSSNLTAFSIAPKSGR